ncbi:MAG: hypothetical protein IGS03_04755 [Candidatus Sericytochromatia bacterium]|nr:hypothetical protein [Candidatus Sericytochromatia bacterium]
MLNASQFPAVRQAWNEVTEDRQISSRELQAVRNQIQLTAPGLSEDEIRSQLVQLLSETQSDLDPQQAQALLESVFQGETLTLQTNTPSHEIEPQAVSFFEDPADAPDLSTGRVVDLEMGSASLTDANGVRTPGADDISGNIDTLRLTVEGGVADFEQMLSATRGKLQGAAFDALRESPLAYAYDDQELQQAAAEIARHLRVESRTQNGEQVYEFNLDPAFRDNLPGWMGRVLSAAEGVGMADFSNPMATLSSPNGQLTVETNNPMLSEALQSPQEAAPDFGPEPVSPMPADASPASESAVREILSRIDRPGNDPRRQSQLISGDRDQRQLMQLYNQGALESLPPELRERAAFWASETAALDAERLLRNWSGQSAGENVALQQLMASPAFQALPADRRAAIVRNSSAEALAQHLVSSGELSPEQQGALASLSPYLELTQETGHTNAEGMLQQGLEALRQQGMDVSARLESTPGPDGSQRYELRPESLTLEGEALQRLMNSHPELAQLGDLSNGRLTLSPEHFSVRFGSDGIELELRNLAISGGTDLTAAADPASGEADPTTVTLDGAGGRAILDDTTHALRDLSLEELSGRLSGDITLDQDVVAAIQTRVNTLLSDMDTYLSQYGLGREQLQQLLSQLPSDGLQRLASSASDNEVNRLARNLGMDSEQIGRLVDLLQEQPVRQLIGELQGLTQRLGTDAQISGELGFNLQNLNLSDSDSGWLASLGQLSLNLDATARSEAGDTALNGALRAEDLRLAGDGSSGAVGPVSGSLTAETVSAEPALADPAPPEPTENEQVAAFIETLAAGGGDYREPASGANRRTEGHLRDEHISEGGLRRGSGLHVDTARAELAKAPASQWVEMLTAGEAERAAFFEAHDIRYGDYLLNYLQQRVLSPQSPPASEAADRQRVSVSGDLASASFDPAGLNFGEARAEASLNAERDGTQTDVTLRAAAGETQIAPEASAIGGIRVSGEGRFEDAEGRVTTLDSEASVAEVSARPEAAGPEPSAEVAAFIDTLAAGGGDYREPASGANRRTEGHLRDEHISEGGLRRGSGLHVDTARAELAKAPASQWADMRAAGEAEREAFFAAHNIEPAYGRYLLNYLDRHVIGQSGAEGGVSLRDLKTSGQAVVSDAGDSATMEGSSRIGAVQLGPDGATAEDLSLNASLAADATRVSAEISAAEARADATGLDLQAEARLALETTGEGARTEVRSGSTHITVADSQITGTVTPRHELDGHVSLETEAFLDLLAQQNQGMADFFREHGVLGRTDSLGIDLTNTGDIRTGANGEVEAYQLRASTSGLETAYGRAAVSLYADDDGSITGNIEISPNGRVAQDMRQQMQSAMREAAQELLDGSNLLNRRENRRNAELLRQAADSLQVELSNGRFAVSLQGQQYVNFNLDLSIVPNGSSIDLTIDQTELQNRFLNGVANAFGMDLNRRAAEAIRAGLDGAGLRPTPQGDYALSIQTDVLMGEILGPDSRNVRIAPRFTKNGNLDIQYWIN